jgi:hypothetical protein
MALQAQEAAFVLDPERPVSAEAGRRDDAVARQEEREAVVRAERAGCASRPRPAGQLGELAVADHLAPGDCSQGRGRFPLERGRSRQVELDISEGDRLPGEVAMELLQNFFDEAVTLW